VSKIPNGLLVPLVIIIGILVVVFSQEPHTACDSQKDVFIESQRGYLFSKVEKGRSRAPQYRRFLSLCSEGGGPGACFEFFALVKKTLRDLEATPLNCTEQFQQIPELKRALADGIEVMVSLAWGAHPPEAGTARYRWLETSDLALFCQLRRNYIRIFGNEQFEALRLRVQSVLPGEPLVMDSEGRCTNCNTKQEIPVDKNAPNSGFIEPENRRRMAPAVLTPEEIWSKSLFSVRCEQFS
jgi:hypothetical protein